MLKQGQSNPSQCLRGYARGFSLIEILVAMAIAAVMIGMAVPYLGGSNDKYAKQEVTRLLAAIEMVRDLAVIEDKEYGLSIDQHGYQFVVFNDEDNSQRWQAIADFPALGDYEFPDTVEINVAIDGENIFAAAEEEVDIFEEDVDIFEEQESKPKIKPPSIYFLSTGEQNQFTLGVAAREEQQSIIGDDEPRFFRIKGLVTGELKYQGPLPGNLFNDIEREYSDYLEQSEFVDSDS